MFRDVGFFDVVARTADIGRTVVECRELAEFERAGGGQDFSTHPFRQRQRGCTAHLRFRFERDARQDACDGEGRVDSASSLFGTFGFDRVQQRKFRTQAAQFGTAGTQCGCVFGLRGEGLGDFLLDGLFLDFTGIRIRIGTGVSVCVIGIFVDILLGTLIRDRHVFGGFLFRFPAVDGLIGIIAWFGIAGKLRSLFWQGRVAGLRQSRIGLGFLSSRRRHQRERENCGGYAAGKSSVHEGLILSHGASAPSAPRSLNASFESGFPWSTEEWCLRSRIQLRLAAFAGNENS
ncbi:hypothetical protein RHIZ404_201017 [Rhizobium sp. EC-SD404]|nr:hypothetical protein RHIZ404_201017 [Rhizobium sp. EC-SD404]